MIPSDYTHPGLLGTPRGLLSHSPFSYRSYTMKIYSPLLSFRPDSCWGPAWIAQGSKRPFLCNDILEELFSIPEGKEIHLVLSSRPTPQSLRFELTGHACAVRQIERGKRGECIPTFNALEAWIKENLDGTTAAYASIEYV